MLSCKFLRTPFIEHFRFLPLRVTQKALQFPVLFSLFFLSLFLDGPTEAFFLYFILLLLHACVTSTERKMPCAFMSCALEIISNGRFKRMYYNLALLLLNSSYLRYCKTQSHRTLQVGELYWRPSPSLIT